MKDSQVQAICRALQYLIANTPPIEKGDRAKAKRAQTIQGLTNACRPSQSDASEDASPKASRGKVRAPGTAATEPAPAVAAGPSIIGINIIPPDLTNVPAVRPGTVAGSPFVVNPKVAQIED